jgi:hypothetical protein
MGSQLKKRESSSTDPYTRRTRRELRRKISCRGHLSVFVAGCGFPCAFDAVVNGETRSRTRDPTPLFSGPTTKQEPAPQAGSPSQKDQTPRRGFATGGRFHQRSLCSQTPQRASNQTESTRLSDGPPLVSEATSENSDEATPSRNHTEKKIPLATRRR